MHKTKVEAALAAAEAEHADDPDRVEILRRARLFKSSWLQLAEGLIEVRRAGHFKRWGYESLDQYAKAELHLRPETVEKLTGSFGFLKRRAPEVLERDGVAAPIPTYQAIDFLRRAEEQDEVPQETVKAVRARVLEDGAGLAVVAREYRDTVFPPSASERRDRDRSALKNVATRLHELLEETRVVPRKLAGEVGEALAELLEALGADEERAA